MSLLLDALKKAADDKKKSVDEPADESLAQGTDRASDEDSLELELDDKQFTDNELVDNFDFPQVKDQPVVAQTPHETRLANNQTETDATADNSDEFPQDTDTVQPVENAPEQPAELELETTHNADTEITNHPETTTAEPRQTETSTTPAETDSEDTDTDAATPSIPRDTAQSPATETTHTNNPVMQRTDRARPSTDNEAALSALINKSNQYQQRAQKKRTILLATLILLLISGSALFFYLKTEMASQELYIAQNNRSPLLGEPSAVSNSAPLTADNQAVVIENTTSKPVSPDHTHNTQTTSHSHPTETSALKPRSSQISTPKADKVSRKPAEKKIHIQQSSREDPIDSLIMNAYNAFQRGQYEQAQMLYQQVLEQEPRNRDASLGLAAIALKQQRYEYARQKYLALLKLKPKDSLAIAGLSSINQGSLQNSSDAALSESQLKFMLKEQPDAAHLYFALGSLYAGKGQWPQAQSAYFSAWAADSNNADYTYNLAVSLDHINQSQQALQYYQLSLRLMRDSAASFSAAQVQQRINSLQEATQ